MELIEACKNNDLERVKNLIYFDTKIDVNFQDANKYTALIWASFKGYTDIVKFLINQDKYEVDINIDTRGIDTSKRVDIHSFGCTALLFAIDRMHAEIVNFLVAQNKYSIKFVNFNSIDILFWAAQNGQIETIKILLGKDIDINFRDIVNGNTILLCAVYKGYTEIVELLLGQNKYILDINIQNYNGDTALILASYNKHEEIAKLLIEQDKYKIDLNIQNLYKNTALIFAIEKSLVKTVKLLLKKKVNINIKNRHGYKPLSLAQCYSNTEIIKLLKNYIMFCEEYTILVLIFNFIEKYYLPNEIIEMIRNFRMEMLH